MLSIDQNVQWEVLKAGDLHYAAACADTGRSVCACRPDYSIIWWPKWTPEEPTPLLSEALSPAVVSILNTRFEPCYVRIHFPQVADDGRESRIDAKSE